MSQRKPMTNGDRIRSMSDEELCDFVILMWNEICESVPLHECTHKCPECILKWLQQPEETGEELESDE